MMSKPRLVPVGKGHSFFSFINKYCLGEAPGLSHNSAFHRLCSLMRKMDVKTAAIEEMPHLHDEIKEECSALNTYYKKEIKVRVFRITFLTEKISTLKDISILKNESFLSSSIVINFKEPKRGWRSYLFSAIVTIPKIKNDPKFGDIPLLNNYLHICRTFKREINISEDNKIEYAIRGTYFCEQNSITSVCAHASLCMILNNMDLTVGLITPEHINRIIEVDHNEKRFGDKPNVRFTNEEIEKVLRTYGLTYELLDFFGNPNMEYNDYIYKYIESKCPVLLIFQTDATVSHVVPIFGHTLNSDMWRPEAEIAYSPSSRLDFLKSASAWVDHFIIHDDNFGMYFCLPVDALKRITLPKYDPTFRAHYAVVIKPQNVTTPPREAEWASSIVIVDFLQWCHRARIPLDVWTNRLADRIFKGRPIVIRTLLATKEDYIKNLNEKDFENNSFSDTDKQELTKDLPDYFWLSEMTLPDLYTANKNKVIDFFYGCNYSEPTNENEIWQRWLQLRFPFVLLKQNAEGSITPFPLSVKSHYPLFRFVSEQDVLDW